MCAKKIDTVEESVSSVSQDTGEFLRIWWQSETLAEVIEYYSKTDKFKDKDSKQITLALKNRANALRKAGVPMKYHPGRTRQAAAGVDPKEAMAFIAKLGVDPKAMKEAEKLRQAAIAETARRLGRKK